MPLDYQTMNPAELGAPLGLYSQISRVSAAELIFIAGQLPIDSAGKMVGADDFDAQMRQVITNVGNALHSVECSFANVVRFTTYLIDDHYIELFMQLRHELFPTLFANEKYPPNTLLIVKRLVRKGFLIEIDAIAAR